MMMIKHGFYGIGTTWGYEFRILQSKFLWVYRRITTSTCFSFMSSLWFLAATNDPMSCPKLLGCSYGLYPSNWFHRHVFGPSQENVWHPRCLDMKWPNIIRKVILPKLAGGFLSNGGAPNHPSHGWPVMDGHGLVLKPSVTGICPWMT